MRLFKIFCERIHALPSADADDFRDKKPGLHNSLWGIQSGFKSSQTNGLSKALLIIFG